MNKMKLDTNNRFQIMYAFICIVFVGLFVRMSYMTIIQGDDFYSVAENKVYKKIESQAPRGEIKDRNGKLLAGNRPSFTVLISQNELVKEKINDTALILMEILRNNNESVSDEFPIKNNGTELFFAFDEKISQWKEKNNIELSKDAKDSFFTVVQNAKDQGLIEATEEESAVDLQKKLNNAGFYPPISVSRWEFTEEIRKQEWLAKYKIKDKNIDASAAYKLIKEYYEIPDNLDDTKVRDILVIRDMLKSKGYFQYEPVQIAVDVSEKTVSTIEELSIDIPGVTVQINPIRYYPNGSLASHILGQIGRISTQEEIAKYVNEKKYNSSDIIGKTGIEKKYEEILKGKNGYRRVQVDAFGRLINSIDYETPLSGDTVYLTIDSDLQKVAEESLKKTLELIQTGGTYESEWGNVRLRKNNKIYNKAASGAVVALDVKSGEVLAMASYPDYDPNIFTTGVSASDMDNLMPENLNDPLSPKPLYNIATMTSVQPGSTFKMITGLAALESGLDPNYKIKDEGFIEMGGRRFGCWFWNDYGGKHGEEDLVAALRDSCNYYFYSISVGYDYAKEKPLPVEMNSGKILDMAKLFGLDDFTGIQIEEVSGKVPDPKQKLDETRKALYYSINAKMRNYFTDITSSNPLYEERINKIVSWMDENPSRTELINRMKDLKVKEDLAVEIAEYVKYSYYNQGTWKTGDTFNLSIGQGAHAYTPLQIANYISAIANNGYLNKVTVVDRIEKYDKSDIDKIARKSEEIPVNKNNLEYLRRGMIDVTDEGTAKEIFQNFPIKVAAKSGTAQKSGKIPAIDEEEYLLSHMRDYRVDKTQAVNLANKLKSESTENLASHRYLRRAILELNPSLSDEDINRFKDNYDNFAWFVSYAPHDNPEIAVVSLIFQGGSGGYAGPVAREIIGQYFGINNQNEDITTSEQEQVDENSTN